MPNKTYRVLVVEDNPGDRYVIGKAFNECGYLCDVTEVISHPQALELLNVEMFDLLVSFFGTDTERGTWFVREARRRAPRSPLIILSGVADPTAAIDAGAHAFVRKVSDVKLFFDKIEGIMRFWADVAELPRPEHKTAHTHAVGHG